MTTSFSPRQVAEALGVSEASLKRWCDKGLLLAQRTAGGHRRISRASVMQFLRSSGRPLVDPSTVAIPAGTASRRSDLATVVEDAVRLLSDGDHEALRRLVLSHYLGGHSAVEICDELLAPAFARIGERWEHRGLEIYQERRASEMTLQLIQELLALLPPAGPESPKALGGTLEGDHYDLPTRMVELALRECGWRAHSYGTNLPFETLIAAIEAERPRILWVSVSHVRTERFADNFERLHDVASAHGTALVVGGRALTPQLRQQLRYSTFCDTLGHLRAFAESLEPTGQRDPAES